MAGATERALRLVAAVLVLLAAAPAGRAAGAPATDDETALLERFAPVVAIRHQDEECGDGERFLPVPVETIFGRDDVVLRDAAGDVVATAPTAADLVAGDTERWIDLPGDALRPGCSYERWFRTLDAEPAIYGRLTTDDGHLVAQYWTYWIYNQWNDVHESDWEMIQLDFGETDVAGALERGPVTYAYAQHEGSEYAAVGDDGATADDQVDLVDGTRPVVYAAEGSHASYFSASQWFGKSSATGFGCDDTTAPLDLLRPELIVLPAGDPPTEGPFAWLAYEGRWGQRAPAFNDGPTGPATKEQWDDPVGWVERSGRSGAIALPFAESRPTDYFCGLTAWGSAQFNKLLDQPLATVLSGVAALAAIAFVVHRSSQGLLVRAARQWWVHARQLVPVGAVVLVGVLGSSALVRVLERLTPVGLVLDTLGGSSPWVLPIITGIGSLVAVPVYAWVTAATIAVTDGEPTVGSALGRPLRGKRPSILPTMLFVFIIELALFVFTPVLILVSRWLVAPVLATRQQMSLKQSLGRSHRLIMGHGWRAAGLLLTVLVVAASTGFVGALLLLFTNVSFLVATVVTTLLGIVVVPYITLVVVGFHDELAAERAPFLPSAT